MVEEISNDVDQTFVKYLIGKETTKSLIYAGHASYSKLINLVSIHKATSLTDIKELTV